MKNCIRCTSPITDNSNFCAICGQEQQRLNLIKNNYCTMCGHAIAENTNQCGFCGNMNYPQETQYLFNNTKPKIILSLSSRIFSNAIIWLIIIIIQYMALFTNSIMLIYSGYNNPSRVAELVLFGIFPVLNTLELIKMFKLQKSIQSNYVGIIYDNRFSLNAVFFYLWNSLIALYGFSTLNPFLLFFSSLIAFAIVFDFIFLKLFIIRNKHNFIELEKSQVSST